MSDATADPIEEPGKPVEAVDWWGLDYDAVDEQLVCPICRTALVDPHCTDCGHTFCKDCIVATNRLAIEDARPTRCPIDRKPVLQEPQPAPLIVRAMLDNLVVRCPFADRGCEFKNERWLLDSHVALECQYVRVACHPPCPHKIERRNFDPDGCKCSDDGAAADEDDAAASEPPEEAEHCPGRDLGCSWEPPEKGDAQVVEEHAKGCPMALVAPTLHAQSAKIDSIQLENRALRRQLESAARQIQRSASDLDSQILSEYERLWSEIQEASASRASQQQVMIKLSMENVRMSEELSFLRSTVDSLRRQMQLMTLSQRRLSLYSSLGSDLGSLVDGESSEESRQRRSAQKL